MNERVLPAQFHSIGQPLRRKEDHRLLTGQGRFSDDFFIPGQAHAVMVRSPHPHARILRLDSSKAKAMPGVLAVFDGADAMADGLGPIPHTPVPATRFDMKLTAPGGGKLFSGPHFLLPADRVRHVGEAVAMVVSDTRAQALDAAEAIEVEYEELPFVTATEDALAPGAPVLWEEAPDNVLIDTAFGDAAATDRAFAAAAHIVKMQFNIGRVTAVPIELRSALAHYDAATARHTLYAGSGGAVRQKQELAAVLGIEPAKLRVLSYDVGGNFGARNRPYVEFGLVLWAAKKLGRPVKYTATRSEAFLSDYQGRDLLTKVELALAAHGRILAMRADNISNVGARCVSLSPLSKGAGLITGSYDIPVASLRARAVFTNTMPTNAYRSSGRPEVTFAIERLMDLAAHELGIDRIAIRRKNLVRPSAMPYTNAVGMTYDSGTYAANMELAMRIADWDGFKLRKRQAKKRGRLLGLGLANYVESSIGSPRERAEITVRPEGHVDVVIGTQPSGQGHETSFAQVAADLLAVPIESVNIIMGDTDIVSVGGGSHSGRSMRHAGAIISQAAGALIAKGKQFAALALDTAPEMIAFADGRFSTPISNRTFDFLELAKEIAKESVHLALPAELKDGLTVAAEHDMHEPVFPNGCAICEVEVDPETGLTEITRYAAVDDVGRCVNPLIVHGQTHGGIAQGVGQAMWEQCYIEPSSGQPLTGSFMDYAMPRSTTVVVNAIVDALRDFGIRDLAMPATPFAVWQAIQNAKSAR
jgi:aerobic carbon-monoxide dehydrogenase large subunit